MTTKREKRLRRKIRVRARISGTPERPRLSVFRSNTTLYVQVIDDVNHATLCASRVDGKTINKAKELGATIAQILQKKKITSVVFDRSGYRYHGAVKALIESAREGGLKV